MLSEFFKVGGHNVYRYDDKSCLLSIQNGVVLFNVIKKTKENISVKLNNLSSVSWTEDKRYFIFVNTVGKVIQFDRETNKEVKRWFYPRSWVEHHTIEGKYTFVPYKNGFLYVFGEHYNKIMYVEAKTGIQKCLVETEYKIFTLLNIKGEIFIVASPLNTSSETYEVENVVLKLHNDEGMVKLDLYLNLPNGDIRAQFDDKDEEIKTLKILTQKAYKTKIECLLFSINFNEKNFSLLLHCGDYEKKGHYTFLNAVTSDIKNNLLILGFQTYIRIIDLKTKEVISTYDFSPAVSDFLWFDSKKIIVLHWKKIYIETIGDGKQDNTSQSGDGTMIE